MNEVRLGRFRRHIAAAALSLGLLPGASQAETLAQTLVHAYEYSGLLSQNRALLRAADEEVAQAVAALRPILNYTISTTYADPVPMGADNTSASAGISASMLLYDFGASQISVEIAKELVLATRQSLVSVEQAVLTRAIGAFMNVRRDSEFVGLRLANVNLIGEELSAAEDRFDVGEVTRTDVSQAEARLAAARSLLAAAEGALVTSSAEFLAAVGRPPQSPSSPGAPPETGHSLQAAVGFALQNHPDIKAAQHQLRAAELSVQAAEAARNPTLNLQAGASVDQDGNDSSSITLSLSGPIYQGGAISSRVRALIAQRESAAAGLYLTRLAVEQEVTGAFALLRVAQASRESSDRQVRAATVAFNGARAELEAGSRTTLDVLNAEQELLDARVNLISAQVDEVIAAYRVLASMGLLTAENLGLNVPIYDPAAYYNFASQAPSSTTVQGQALDRVLEAIGAE